MLNQLHQLRPHSTQPLTTNLIRLNPHTILIDEYKKQDKNPEDDAPQKPATFDNKTPGPRGKFDEESTCADTQGCAHNYCTCHGPLPLADDEDVDVEALIRQKQLKTYTKMMSKAGFGEAVSKHMSHISNMSGSDECPMGRVSIDVSSCARVCVCVCVCVYGLCVSAGILYKDCYLAHS